MGRGFLAGIFWGGLVGLGMLLVSSQAIERQTLSLPQPTAAAVEVPGGSEFDQAQEETDPVLPEAETRPASEAAGLVEAPNDAVETPPSFDTSALEVPTPSVGQADDLNEAPSTTEAPEAPSISDAARPADSTSDLLVPEAPGSAPETNDDAPSEVAAPTAPEDNTDTPLAEDTAPSGTDVVGLPATNEDQAALSETSNAPSISSDATAPSGLTAPSIGEEPALPSAGDTGNDAPRLPELSEPSAPETVEDAPEIAAAPDAPTTPVVIEDAAPSSGGGGEDTGAFEIGEAQEDQIEDVVEEILSEAEGATEDNSETRVLPTVRRLGTENSAEVEPETEGDTEDGTATDETEADSEGDPPADDAEVAEADGPAIQAFRTEFDNAEGNPLMALVLIQDGNSALSADQLDGLPASVALALDAGGPDAAALADSYRSAGREVVMIPSLPQGATPQDVEQALLVNFDTIPEAVALMDVSGSSFQSDRAAVQQIVNVVTASGHGLITFPRGLNTAHQSATRAGVPTGLIFRRLDGGGESGDQIQRTLDRAAFRARQDEAVILVGTTAPETLAAIVEWTAGNRAASVTLAPISAALLNE